MADDLMAWLRRLYDRLRYPGQSVQYELQRRTHQGGWKNFYGSADEVDYATSFPTPPPQPSFGSETAYPPGKYRCVKRVNGRIDAVLWTVESSDADAYYDRLQEQAAAEAAAPTLAEVEADLEAGNHETLLDWMDWKMGGSGESADDDD